MCQPAILAQNLCDVSASNGGSYGTLRFCVQGRTKSVVYNCPQNSKGYVNKRERGQLNIANDDVVAVSFDPSVFKLDH